MFGKSTINVLVVVVLLYAGLWLCITLLPLSLSFPLDIIFAIPLLLTYALSELGVPGLLAQSGGCGWGWCSATVLGWVVGAIGTLFIVWMIAWGIASGIGRLRRLG